MKISKIIDRIKYLKTELAHSGYHDGWVLEGMRDELSDLETELYFHTRNKKIEGK